MKKTKISKLNKKVLDLIEDYTAADNEKNEYLTEISNLEESIDYLNQIINSNNDEINFLKNNIDELNQVIEDNNNKINYCIPNILHAFSYVILAISWGDFFVTSAIFLALNTTFSGVFLFPLLGSGDKYGLSVSIKILSSGTIFIISSAFFEFLNVIGPANDI